MNFSSFIGCRLALTNSSDVRIGYTIFSCINSGDVSGTALFVSNKFNTVDIKCSQFEFCSNTGSYGGAIRIEKSDSVFLKSSLFQHNLCMGAPDLIVISKDSQGNDVDRFESEFCSFSHSKATFISHNFFSLNYHCHASNWNNSYQSSAGRSAGVSFTMQGCDASYSFSQIVSCTGTDNTDDQGETIHSCIIEIGNHFSNLVTLTIKNCIFSENNSPALFAPIIGNENVIALDCSITGNTFTSWATSYTSTYTFQRCYLENTPAQVGCTFESPATSNFALVMGNVYGECIHTRQPLCLEHSGKVFAICFFLQLHI